MLLPLQLMLILGLARLLRRPAAAVGLPAVIAEMVAGFLLGPTAFGALAPAAFAAAFPPEGLHLVGRLGTGIVAAYSLVIGLDWDPRHVEGRRLSLVVTALASLLVPALAGWSAAALLDGRMPPGALPPGAFRLCVALGLAVTAFPVLLRIVEDAGMSEERAGAFSIGVSALLECLIWAGLPVVLAVACAGSAAQARCSLAGLLGFTVAWLTLVRAALRWLWARIPAAGLRGLLLLAVVGIGSAFVTDRLGLHAIFGAFVAGLVVPRTAAAQLAGRVKPACVFLLPVFFAATGLRTSIGLGREALAAVALLTLLAYAAKFLPTTLAARATTGLTWSEAATVGHLMCAKGAIGFAVLEVCRGSGLLDAGTFSLLAGTVAANTVLSAWGVAWQRRGRRRARAAGYPGAPAGPFSASAPAR